MRKALHTFREFFKLEASGGICLGLAAVLALIVKNSPLEDFYDHFLEVPVVLQIGQFIIDKPLLLWINDGLMAVFFLLVGLEIKREVMQGQLSSREQIMLPSIAAIGGLLLPALIYVGLNFSYSENLNGWAIPAATDIAFAIGIVLLLGKRVPQAIKVTLVAIAILDDLAAILIIALFYTSSLSTTALMGAAIATYGLYLLNRFHVMRLSPYIVVGVILWACVLKSGVHATLAGVVLAFFIPLKTAGKAKSSQSLLLNLEHSLHPWVSFLVLPLFAYANAGVSLKGLGLEQLTHPITMGILLGLFIGKQLGVWGITKAASLTGLIRLPKGVTWRQYYGMALITGVGFTMSLFIGTLAFSDPYLQTYVRLGVIGGSVLSGCCGVLVFLMSPKQSA